MWQGILAGYEAAEASRERRQAREDAVAAREEDRAFRREMFNAQVLEGRRQTVLQLMLAEREKDAALQAEVRAAVSRGMSLDVAQAAQDRGQLGIVMETLAAENYSKNVLQAFESSIREQLSRNSEEGEASDDAVANVLTRSLERGANLDNPRSSYGIMLEEVLNETSIETLEDMQLRLMQGQQRQAMAPLDISTYTGSVDTTEQNRIRSQLIDRFGTAFGPNVFRKLEDGNYEISANAPPEVSMLVNRAVDEVVNMSRGPSRVGNVTENIAVVGNKIMEVAGPNVLEAKDLVSNFDTLMQSSGPQDFFSYLEQLSRAGANVTSLVQTPPVVEPTAVDAMETLGDRPTRRNPGGVRNPQTSASGFNIDINESFVRP